ncbi:MAG: orotidine 5'-phosphate decarboxylase [Ignisphaera sp.]|nr:orotidine 5'-phosphate decarboxylase [Ignisphaera sp.]MCX8168100.1 orotidine 5'-phosphate decarboxylase [Ignisphaera sp.]MDW8086229.1 orotidine 5'-phosphate decarboxylase / HUMPS family protein [Ignisphaera sp.]
MIVIALDPPSSSSAYEWIIERVAALSDIVQGFKIGLPAIIRLGASKVGKIFRNYSGLLIADLKLADIGDIMALSVEILHEHGFNAVIAHSFIGFSQGLDLLSAKCRELNIKLITVVSMSHSGSTEYIDRHIYEFLGIAQRVKSWGIIAPATRLEILRYIRRNLGNDIKILSPGVGVQGMEPGMALCNGADYEIIGRAITYSQNFREAAFGIIERQKRKVVECKKLQWSF